MSLSDQCQEKVRAGGIFAPRPLGFGRAIEFLSPSAHSMIHYDPATVPHRDLHQILLSGIAPRPIAFVSSKNSAGQLNLAPFSFFNCFASKPPVVAIGPAIAAASGREKDTLLNILQTRECTISIVSYSFVHQMNISSTDYEYGVDEYTKSGLHKVDSDVVAVPYVAESNFSMECTLIDNRELFREIGGNGNIMLLRVQRIHVKEDVITDGKIDPRKMDQVARMGYKWYARVRPEDCFEAAQPRTRGIGMDQLPESIRQSTVLSGNDLARLALVTSVPEAVGDFSLFTALAALRMKIDESVIVELDELKNALTGGINDSLRHHAAKLFCAVDDVASAWQCLLASK